jgi:hypothetical protein
VSRIEITDVAVATAPDGESTRLSCRIAGGGLPDALWFDASPGSADLLSNRGNWAAVALLYPAMRLGADLHVVADMSPELVDAMNHDLQAFLVLFDPALRRIAVTCRAARDDAPRGSLVATGFSAGIDSFATLARYHFAPIDPGLAVSALAVFDVGAFGRDGVPHFTRAAARSGAFAAAHGLRSISLRSNLDAVYRAPGVGRPGFERTNTFRNVAAALALESGVCRYYVSSSFAPAEIGVRDVYNPAYLDPILLPLLSTERLRFVSACAGLTRVEKTRLVADLPEARPLLDVCTRPQERGAGRPLNCSHCAKCVRTLFTLEALGRLDDFAAVFDVGMFRSGRKRFLDDVRRSAAGGNSLDAEVVALIGPAAVGGGRRRWWHPWR